MYRTASKILTEASTRSSSSSSFEVLAMTVRQLSTIWANIRGFNQTSCSASVLSDVFSLLPLKRFSKCHLCTTTMTFEENEKCEKLQNYRCGAFRQCLEQRAARWKITASPCTMFTHWVTACSLSWTSNSSSRASTAAHTSLLFFMSTCLIIKDGGNEYQV